MNAWGEDWAQAFCEIQKATVRELGEAHLGAVFGFEAWAEGAQATGASKPGELTMERLRDVAAVVLPTLPEGSPEHDMLTTWALLLESSNAA